jgi:GTP pyrophosphokinase
VLEKFFKVPSATELYIRIAKGKIDLAKVRTIKNVGGMLHWEREVKKTKITSSSDINKRIDKKKDVLIIGDDFNDIEYSFARCCNPLPGDSVFGFITIEDGIKIHRKNCPNAENLMSKNAYRCISAKWRSKELKEHIAKLRIIGIDDIGIVNKITEIISFQHNVNMKSISFDSQDGLFEGKIQVFVFDKQHLDELIDKFVLLEGVKRVERWDEIQEEPSEDEEDNLP